MCLNSLQQAFVSIILVIRYPRPRVPCSRSLEWLNNKFGGCVEVSRMVRPSQPPPPTQRPASNLGPY